MSDESSPLKSLESRPEKQTFPPEVRMVMFASAPQRLGLTPEDTDRILAAWQAEYPQFAKFTKFNTKGTQTGRFHAH